MLLVPRHSREEIENILKVGDRVEWLGQPAIVIEINKSRVPPLILRTLLPDEDQAASFREINDIVNPEYKSPIVGKVAAFGRRISTMLC